MLIAPSTYYEHVDRQPSHRQLRDESLEADIERVHTANYGWPDPVRLIQEICTRVVGPAL